MERLARTEAAVGRAHDMWFAANRAADRAEAELAEAVAEKEEARAADATLRQEVEQVRRAVEYAQTGVRQTAARVLATAPAVAAAVERLKQAERELIDAGDQVMFLVNQHVIPVRLTPPGGTITDEGLEGRAGQAVRRLEMPPLSWHDLIKEKPDPAHWEDVLDRLQADAGAEIPD